MSTKTTSSSSQPKSYLRLFATGFSMGLADLIPGVSGGTIAFISGIYEELLYSIKVASGEAIKLLLKGKIVDAIRVVPLRFLIPLLLGIFTAIFSLANLLSYLLVEYPTFVFALFFGLVLASTWLVLKRVVKWDKADIFGFIISAIGAYILVGSVPVSTPESLPWIFLSGMIAICAMILPGISGSFILLLLGKYDQILGAAKNFDIMTLSVFMVGCVLGIALFSRLLSWLFAKHHDISVAILAGFMLGSVRKIWPWKEVLVTRINSHGEVVPFIEKNILPGALTGEVIFTLALMIIGVGLILYLERLQATKEKTSDIDSSQFKKEHKKAIEKES